MDCDAVAERLQAFLDQELSADEAEVLEAHTTTCADCRRRRDERESLRHLVRSQLSPSAPPDLRRSILEAATAGGATPTSTTPRSRSGPDPSDDARRGFGSIVDWMRPRRLVPVLATAAILTVVVWQALDRPRPPRAFRHPATVVAIRLGEDPAGPLEPTPSGWTLGGTQ